VVFSSHSVWAARVEPDELASLPALPAALGQGEQQVQLVWRQGEQQGPRGGLPDEQRALVWLPVLVLDERRVPVWLRVLLPEERVLLPDGSQAPRGGLQAWPGGPQRVQGGRVLLPLRGG
jgi:hypothetical protein